MTSSIKTRCVCVHDIKKNLKTKRHVENKRKKKLNLIKNEPLLKPKKVYWKF